MTRLEELARLTANSHEADVLSKQIKQDRLRIARQARLDGVHVDNIASACGMDADTARRWLDGWPRKDKHNT